MIIPSQSQVVQKSKFTKLTTKPQSDFGVILVVYMVVFMASFKRNFVVLFISQ